MSQSRSVHWLLGFTFSLALLASAGCPANSDATFAELADFTRAEITRQTVPGAAIAVVENGALTHQMGFGTKQLGKDDPVHANTLPAERQGDPAGADTKFEGASSSGQVGEEVHDGVNGRRLEPLRAGRVVPLRHTFVEVVLWHEHTVPGAAGAPPPFPRTKTLARLTGAHGVRAASPPSVVWPNLWSPTPGWPTHAPSRARAPGQVQIPSSRKNARFSRWSSAAPA